MQYTVDKVDRWARKQLIPTYSDVRPTWADLALNSWQYIADAKDQKEWRQALGSHSGLVRRWRTALVFRLTRALVPEGTSSREAVRTWQQQTFGHGVSSHELKHYAVPHHVGHGRPGPLIVPPGATEHALEVYGRYKWAFSKVASVS